MFGRACDTCVCVVVREAGAKVPRESVTDPEIASSASFSRPIKEPCGLKTYRVLKKNRVRLRVALKK